ncbi:pentapeptide repeat-containing protein [Rhizobium leguminosarum]|uniref:pentapeptide repeat-containing protein n=1 Tax=Rhizobium leguminosarum TaxID=384 RepID=UPI001C97036E|nr:pentapeptide repeat-containing protein [Rhizobium leguminosarum]MBY5741053.1 hypothetical protein [Rhizobium leguminosarum]
MTIDWLADDNAIVLSAEETRAFQIFDTAEHSDYVSLVRQAGLDPAQFFEGGNWEGMDLRDSDVTGVSFRSADLTGACLYRDQYDIIRQTKPRTLDGARVQESREGGKGSTFTIEFDEARDQAKARTDFQAILKNQLSRKDKGEIEKIDWPLVTRYLRRLDQPIGRIWALDEILDQLGAPPTLVYDACKPKFKLGQVLRVLEWSVAIELLQIISLPDDNTRITFLEERATARTYLDPILTAKVIEGGADLDLFRRVIELCQMKGWPLPPFVQWTAASKLVKTMDEVRSFLNLLSKVGVRPQPALFAILADRARTFAGVREFLDLMAKEGIKPDMTVFSKLAEATKTMDRVHEFLDLMAKADVKPDMTVFSRLAEATKTMDGVREFLDLMAKADVKPDMTVFSRLAEATKTMNGVREFLDLMAKVGVKPDMTVFSRLAEATKTMNGVREFLDLMAKVGVKPDMTVFSRLAEATKTIDGVREFLDLMAKASVKPDHRLWKVFVGSGRTIDDVQEFIAKLLEHGRKPTILELNKLIRNTENRDEAERVWSLIFSLGLKPDHFTWGTLINKMPNWAEAWNVYRSRRPDKALVTEAALAALLRKVTTRQEVQVTLEEYNRRRVTMEANSVSAAMRSPLADEDLVWTFRRMKKMGLDVQAIDSTTWTEGAERFDEFKKRL